MTQTTSKATINKYAVITSEPVADLSAALKSCLPSSSRTGVAPVMKGVADGWIAIPSDPDSGMLEHLHQHIPIMPTSKALRKVRYGETEA